MALPLERLIKCKFVKFFTASYAVKHFDTIPDSTSELKVIGVMGNMMSSLLCRKILVRVDNHSTIAVIGELLCNDRECCVNVLTGMPDVQK